MADLQVTSLHDLQGYSKGTVVELPPFANGQPFIARLKRPSLLAMMKKGDIPNTLLAAASALFSGSHMQQSIADDQLYGQIYDVSETLARAALLEPTYDQIRQAGVELTDDQLMFLFTYTQRGVKALETFRPEQATNPGTEHKPTVPDTAE